MEKLKESFNHFCYGTTLHGWQNLAQSHTKFQRCLWLGILLAAISGATYFVIDTTFIYLRSSTNTLVESHTAPLSDITFPEAIVCNINQVQASFVRTLEKHGAKNVDLLEKYFINGFSQDLDAQDKQKLNDLINLTMKLFPWNTSMPLESVATQKCQNM